MTTTEFVTQPLQGKTSLSRVFWLYGVLGSLLYGSLELFLNPENQFVMRVYTILGLIFTVYVLMRRSRPLPWHFGHGFSMTVPLPRQRGHGCESANRPWLSAFTPRPLHSGQMIGAVPGRAPVPPHSRHAVVVSTGTGGSPELVTINPGTNTLGVLDGLGGGALAKVRIFDTTTPAKVIRVGDFTRAGLGILYAETDRGAGVGHTGAIPTHLANVLYFPQHDLLIVCQRLVQCCLQGTAEHAPVADFQFMPHIDHFDRRQRGTERIGSIGRRIAIWTCNTSEMRPSSRLRQSMIRRGSVKPKWNTCSMSWN